MNSQGALDLVREKREKNENLSLLEEIREAGEINPIIRENLIKTHLDLVNFVSQKYRGLNSSLFNQEDLKSYGTIGLIGAIDRFEINKIKNSSLKSFFALRIRGAISDYLRKQDNLSRSSRKRLKELQKNVDLLTNQKKEVSEQELAQKMGISQEKVREIQRDSEFMVLSLDSELSEEKEHKSNFHERVADPAQNLELLLEKKFLKNRISKVLRTLPKREKKTIVLYYFNGFSMKQIAKILEISESRACQIRSRALLILRSKLKLDFLL